jgi:hypothetical protein
MLDYLGSVYGTQGGFPPIQRNHVFGGQIDELGLYHRALNEEEIKAIFLAGSAGKCKSNLPLPS